MAEEKKDKKLNVYFPHEDPNEKELLVKIIDNHIKNLELKVVQEVKVV